MSKRSIVYIYNVNIQEGEVWYGSAVEQGDDMPLDAKSDYIVNTDWKVGCNQMTSCLVSNKGRYIWSDRGFIARFKKGVIHCKSTKAPITVESGFGDLKGAYMALQRTHFPANGRMPAELMFRAPQYCTWIQLDTNQNQQGILDYARGIASKGMPAGELIIDDGWQISFGDWDFRKEAFVDAKAMCDELKKMGFTVLLWICPFVSSKSKHFQYLKKNKLLVRNKYGIAAKRKWWNGADYILDFTNPDAVKWFKGVTDRLMSEYGVQGFKQDAGDTYFYRDDDRAYEKVDANGHNSAWGRSALAYEFNELRASFNLGGLGIAQRLGDKMHSWDKNGLKQLIPHALQEGLLGYPFVCPDMVGGGSISDFRDKEEKDYDHELFIRWAEASALMPMMQYSLAIWNFKNRQTAELVRDCCRLHEKYADYIIEEARKSVVSGEPILRYLEYSYPCQGYERVTDMFMLADKYLVAPILTPKTYTKTLTLPRGSRWRYVNGAIYQGGITVSVDAPIDVLPVFEKID